VEAGGGPFARLARNQPGEWNRVALARVQLATEHSRPTTRRCASCWPITARPSPGVTAPTFVLVYLAAVRPGVLEDEELLKWGMRVGRTERGLALVRVRA
jgi:hypothetical protein